MLEKIYFGTAQKKNTTVPLQLTIGRILYTHNDDNIGGVKGNVLSVSGSWAISVDYIAYFPVWKHDIAVLLKPRQFSSNENINNLTPDKSHICRGANYEAIEISDCD